MAPRHRRSLLFGRQAINQSTGLLLAGRPDYTEEETNPLPSPSAVYQDAYYALLLQRH